MNIIIEKSPESYTLDYNNCVIFEKGKLSEGIEKLKNMYYDEQTESFGPFEGDDAISFLKVLDYQAEVS